VSLLAGCLSPVARISGESEFFTATPRSDSALRMQRRVLMRDVNGQPRLADMVRVASRDGSRAVIVVERRSQFYLD
jgi:hypothetical protein